MTGIIVDMQLICIVGVIGLCLFMIPFLPFFLLINPVVTICGIILAVYFIYDILSDFNL